MSYPVKIKSKHDSENPTSIQIDENVDENGLTVWTVSVRHITNDGFYKTDRYQHCGSLLKAILFLLSYFRLGTAIKMKGEGNEKKY